MADPSLTPPLPVSDASTPNPQTDFDIGEEYGTARKSLPPAGIVAICVAVIAAIVGVYSLTNRAHAVSTGSIDDVVSVPMPGQEMVMVALNISLQNNEQKPAWIKSISVAADVGGNKQTDEAAPAVDVQRYFQSLPELKQHAQDLLTPETRISPGSKIAGTIVVSFPVNSDAFAARKSLTVTVTPYDELPIVIRK